MAIIWSAAVIFCFALLLGVFFYKAKIWAFVDVIYYPAVAVGVILFFFETDRVRDHFELTDQQNIMKAELERITGERPSVQTRLSQIELINGSGQLLRTISQMSDACAKLPDISAKCAVARKIGPVTKRYEGVLLNFSKPNDFQAICEASSNIWQELENEGALSDFIASKLAKRFEAGLEKEFPEIAFEETVNFLLQPEQELRTFAIQIIEVAFKNEKDKNLMRPIYSAQIDYGMLIARAFSSCLRAPPAIRSGEFSAWTKRLSSKQQQYLQAQEELHRVELEMETLNDVGRFRVFFWPYILIVALSFKFAKSIAGAKKVLKNGG